MSGTVIVPGPVWMPPMRAGETDGRYFDCTPDLGPEGDTFPSLGTLAVTISRQDGAAITSSDLQPAGGAWTNTLDPTQLIPTFGFIAPLASGGVTYLLTLKCSGTTQRRVFIRDWLMSVAPSLG